MFSSITEDVLSVIKAPPLKQSTLVYHTDTDKRASNIRGLNFQFRCRFLYDDNEKSAWGPISEVTVLDSATNVIGAEVALWVGRNAIKITTEIPDDDTLSEMDIAYRIGNLGNWQIVDTIKVGSYRGGNYDYYFYNDKISYVADPGDVLRPYDYVPKKAGAQEVVDDNRLIYGDITEGYNNPKSIDVNLSLNTATTKDFKVYKVRIEKISSHHYRSNTDDVVDLSSYNVGIEVYIAGEGICTRYVYDNPRYWDESIKSPSNVTTTNVLNALVTDMANDPLCAVTKDPISPRLVFRFHHWVNNPDVTFIRYYENESVETLKYGSKEYLGLVYGDERGRFGSVIKNENTILDVPFPTESGGQGIDDQYQIDYTVSHTPPEWAHTWRWVWGGNNISYSQAFILRTHDYADKSIWREDGFAKIKINEGLNNVRSLLNNYSVPNYTFAKGDRLRIIGTREDEDFDGDFTKIDNYVDFEILKFDGVYIYTKDWVNYEDAPDLNISDDDILVEIYRPRKESENVIYYGIGEVHDITNPGESDRSHADSTGTLTIADNYLNTIPLAYILADERVQVGSTSSTSTTTTFTLFPELDERAWWGLRCALVQSMWQSPFYADSRVQDLGEFHVVDDEYREVRTQSLRWGGKFIDLTNVNYTNKFEYDDYDVLDAKHGNISTLRQVGHTLKAIQETKLTSIYLGREFIEDANGNVQLVQTSNVLGSKRPAMEDYGTAYPGSVVVKDRHLYFFDLNASMVIRDAPNGMEVISDVGMKNYFRDFADTVITNGPENYHFVGGYDWENDLYLLLRRKNNYSYSDTLGFHEPSRRWISKYIFLADCFGNLVNNNLIGFKRGALYKHNKETGKRVDIYGTPWWSEIEIIANINPTVNKFFESIEVVSNDQWKIDDNGDIVVEARSLGTNEMRSKILNGDWVNYEGVYRAAFNRDNYGETGAYNDYRLHNGRQLRGRALKINMTIDQAVNKEEVALFLIKIYSSLSP